MTATTLAAEMDTLGLYQRDLIRDLNLNAGDLSQYLNGKRDIQATRQSHFFYYFQALCLEKCAAIPAAPKGAWN